MRNITAPPPTPGLSQESIIPFTGASALIPGRPHRSTLYRAITRGWRGVRLESILIGGRRYTSEEAVQRFLRRLQSVDTLGSARADAPTATPSDADAQLQDLGL